MKRYPYDFFLLIQKYVKLLFEKMKKFKQKHLHCNFQRPKVFENCRGGALPKSESF